MKVSSLKKVYDLVIVGGGAAGFFAAIQVAEINPDLKIVILEKSSNLLSKVKISGGGRCNVTHGCFDPSELVNYYPRGNKELLGPFHRFLCGDMMSWLADHGVETKIEDDGRVFPISNSSSSIVNCFIGLSKKLGIEVITNSPVTSLDKEGNKWMIKSKKRAFEAKNILFATGSSVASWKIIELHGHAIVPPVPSLFTFNINHPALKSLEGISVPNARVKILESDFEDSGALLITHWGLSGPVVLKLSAWAARILHAKNYNFDISVNWVSKDHESAKEVIHNTRVNHGNKKVKNLALLGLPKRLWQRMVYLLKLEGVNYASLRASDIESLVDLITNTIVSVKGKSTFKDEFVTCGGVNRKEINFKTMESKLSSGIYFSGEVIDIDAVTGGFNFQAAWTTAFIAAKAIAEL